MFGGSATPGRNPPPPYVPCSKTVIETEKEMLRRASFLPLSPPLASCRQPRSVALHPANPVAVMLVTFFLRCQPARHDTRLALVHVPFAY